MPLTDRQYFTLRRLHSLSGVVPVGVFLLEHWFTNAFALAGAHAYNEKVEFLRSLPYLFLLELFGIAAPIAFHAAIGTWIYWEARFNNRSLPLKQNFLFTLQRFSGVFLIFYITYHVALTRFAHYFGHDNGDLFRLMQAKLQNPLIVAFYVLGVCAASFHFSNGLWGFGLHWGLFRSLDAQKRWGNVALVVALVMAVVGLNSLLAFGPLGLKPVTIFQPTEPHAIAVPGGGIQAHLTDAPPPSPAPAPAAEGDSR